MMVVLWFAFTVESFLKIILGFLVLKLKKSVSKKKIIDLGFPTAFKMLFEVTVF
jgi:Na+-driven multidrug efflux pump